MNYHLITYGCQMNAADSERIAGVLEGLGHAVTDDEAAADILVINTCMVRKKPEEKVFLRLRDFEALKRAEGLPVVVVAGCMSQKYRDELFARCPAVDIVIGPRAIPELPALLGRALAGERRLSGDFEGDGDDLKSLPVKRSDDRSAYVTIMVGCDNFCSYCVVPFARGRERSFGSAAILDEARRLVAAGYRDLTLLGQNVNSYRSERGGFARLLRDLEAEVAGDYRVRFYTSHPKDMADELIDLFRTSRILARHLHLPVQSGADPVLAAMNRGYTRARYLDLVRKLREARPDIALTTDVIAGFPGETEADVAATLALLEEVRFDAAYTFHYSERPGTRAIELPGKLPVAERKARLGRLIEVQNRITGEKNREQVGRIDRVLVTGPSRRRATEFQGRGSDHRVVNFPMAPGIAIGDFATVRVTEAGSFALRGEVIAPDQ